jgi:hypothetical protein
MVVELLYKKSFKTTLTDEDEEMILEQLNEKLKEIFSGSYIVLTGEGFEAKKNDWTSVPMLRYINTIGFRF